MLYPYRATFLTRFHSSEAYSFSNWQLAFEVDLKLVDATSDDLAEAILKRFHSHSTFKQLILDLSSKLVFH